MAIDESDFLALTARVELLERGQRELTQMFKDMLACTRETGTATTEVLRLLKGTLGVSDSTAKHEPPIQ